MQCLCAGLKKGKDKENEPEELCDHSYCTIRRQKKETKCVDLPPKGLPWASGYLKYLPGQRDLYKDLYLKDMAEQEALKMQGPPCPCPPKKSKGKNCKKQNEADAACLCFCTPLDGSSKKKRRKSTASSRRKSTISSSDEGNGGNGGNGQTSDKQNCCIEFEQVFVCDGNSPQPRKGFLVRPCKRPEAEMALAAAEEARSEGQEDSESNQDKGVICLCIPRQYLQQWRGPEEDLCAKYGAKMECPENGKAVPSASKASLGSKKSGGSKKSKEPEDVEEEAEE